MIGRILIPVTFWLTAQPVLGHVDSTRHRTEVAGLLTVTTKGISTFPNFTLGKPAAIASIAISRGRLSFEPEFRYGLNRKPWNFLFWGRYRVLERQKVRVGVGVQHALHYSSTPVLIEEASRDVIVTRRNLAAEFDATYSPSRSFSIGPYYIYSYGAEKDVAKHTHFLTLRSGFTPVRPPSRYVVRLAPQVYYLRIGDRDGTYASATVALSVRGLPVSVSMLANRAIRSSIPGDAFLWNVSLHYAIR